ncbi:MAG: cyclase family protein [Xanthobacteraceae bacterium]
MDALTKPTIDQLFMALKGMRVVDLAPLLERGIPRWPTHPHLTIDKAVTHEHDGYYCQAIMMAEHTGAHVDAPAHVLPDRMDRTIDTFSADHLIATAVLYDFSDENLKPGQLITADDLRRAEVRSGAAVGEGEIAVVNYGWMARYWRTDAKAQWYVLNAPGMSEDACEFFRERKVKAVATDTVAAETAIIDGVPQDNPGHMKSWLPHDILIIEMLRNLEQVSPRFLFVATPLNIHEGSGSPIRPFAYCPE